MPGPYPPYVRHSQRYSAVPVTASYSDKSPDNSVTSPALMEEALPPGEPGADRMSAVLSSHLQELITRQDILIQESRYARDHGDALTEKMTAVALMGTLLAILSLGIMSYIDYGSTNRRTGVHLVWGVSLISEVAAVAIAIFLPLIQSIADAFNRPIPSENMRWIVRLATVVTGVFMAQGLVLMFYLAVAACWL